MSSYKYDVFLSYAHVDNEKSSSEQEGWVTTFQGVLDYRCNMFLGRPVRIWRDTLLTVDDKATEDQLRKAIRQALAESAILLIVMSPGFVKRDWFTREFSYFFDAAGGEDGVYLGDKSRTFLVYIGVVDRETLPGDIPKVTGWNFFSEDGDTTPSDDLSYWERLNDLVHVISQMLQEMEADFT